MRPDADWSGCLTCPAFPLRGAVSELNGNGGESEPPTVYADLFTGALYLDKPAEIERYGAAFTGIWDHALDEPSTTELIRQAAEALRDG